VFKDVAGDEGLVHARVFVRFEMLQGVLGHALMLCAFCAQKMISIYRYIVAARRWLVPLLGDMVVGEVTGGGRDMGARGSWSNLYQNVAGHVGVERERAGY
jgi:hypothetical protein